MSSYLDGQLGSRSHTRMERHTGECPDCRGIVRSLQRMLGRLHGLPPASPTPEAADIAAAVRARLHEHDGS